MTLHDKPESSLFRWDALNRARQIALGVVILVPVMMVVLLVCALVVPPSPGAAGAPHVWAPLAFLMPPTATPFPTATPTLTPLRIGLVAGHSGRYNDPGAVCADGLTEAQVNRDIAERVASLLQIRGYTVDLLEEFDPRLTNYQALLLLSIHADSCEYINEEASGFKVARVLDSKVPEAEDRLVHCLIDRYARRTGLRFHANSITPDMTSYHGFYEIASSTPGAIIETGFLYLDREILTQQPDLIAQGIVEGIICFLLGGP